MFIKKVLMVEIGRDQLSGKAWQIYSGLKAKASAVITKCNNKRMRFDSS